MGEAIHDETGRFIEYFPSEWKDDPLTGPASSSRILTVIRFSTPMTIELIIEELAKKRLAIDSRLLEISFDGLSAYVFTDLGDKEQFFTAIGGQVEKIVDEQRIEDEISSFVGGFHDAIFDYEGKALAVVKSEDVRLASSRLQQLGVDDFIFVAIEKGLETGLAYFLITAENASRLNDIDDFELILEQQVVRQKINDLRTKTILNTRFVIESETAGQDADQSGVYFFTYQEPMDVQTIVERFAAQGIKVDPHNVFLTPDKKTSLVLLHDSAMLAMRTFDGSILDEVSVSSTQRKGGIDLNPNIYDIKSTGEESEFNFEFNLQETINPNVSGLIPVIINITPVMSIPMLIGIKEEDSELKHI